MTTQVSDTLVFEGRRFRVEGVDGTPLFAPSDFGIEPVELSTACYDGYYCTYEIVEQQLRLMDIHLGLSEVDSATVDAGQGPLMFGRLPREDVRIIRRERIRDGKKVVVERRLSEGYFVDSLHEPWPFTGGMLIGAGLIDMRSPGNYRSPWPHEFEDLRELRIEGGHVVEVRLLSAEAAALRSSLVTDDEDDAFVPALCAWLAQTLLHEYHFGRLLRLRLA